MISDVCEKNMTFNKTETQHAVCTVRVIMREIQVSGKQTTVGPRLDTIEMGGPTSLVKLSPASTLTKKWFL